MTTLTNGAESGTADTTTVTSANSGGGSDDAFFVGTPPVGSAITFDNTHSAHGLHAYKWVPPNSSSQFTFQWSISMGTVYGRFYIWGAANPPALWKTVLRILANGAANGMAGLGITTAGKLTVTNSADSTLATFTNALTLSAWNRIEFKFVLSSTVGSYDVRLYSGDSLTAVETKTGSNANFFGTTADTVWFLQGEASNQGSSARTWWFDDMQVNDSDFSGPAYDIPARTMVLPSQAALRAASW